MDTSEPAFRTWAHSTVGRGAAYTIHEIFKMKDATGHPELDRFLDRLKKRGFKVEMLVDRFLISCDPVATIDIPGKVVSVVRGYEDLHSNLKISIAHTLNRGFKTHNGVNSYNRPFNIYYSRNAIGTCHGHQRYTSCYLRTLVHGSISGIYYSK